MWEKQWERGKDISWRGKTADSSSKGIDKERFNLKPKLDDGGDRLFAMRRRRCGRKTPICCTPTIDAMSQKTSPTPLSPVIVDVFQIRSITKSKGVVLPGQAGLRQYMKGRTKVSEREKICFAVCKGKRSSCGAQGRHGMGAGAPAWILP